MQKGYNPYDPTLITALMYTQFLANSFSSLGSVKNYVAGARTFLKSKQCDPSPFYHDKIKDVYKGNARENVYIPRKAPALEAHHVQELSQVLLNAGNLYSGERASFLIMYSSFLRHSNILPPSNGEDHHMVRTRDVNSQPGIIWIDVYSSKTILRPEDAVSIPVYAAEGPHCAVGSWHNHLLTVPHHPDGPAFLTSKGAPLSSYSLIKLLRDSLSKTSCSYYNCTTLHSFRRTGAIQAAKGGASLQGVASLGTWQSDSVFDYAPRKLFSDAPKIIADSLAVKN